jgi:hypothetical protein
MRPMSNSRGVLMLLGAALVAGCAGASDPQVSATPANHVPVSARAAVATVAPAAADYTPWAYFVSWTGERGGVAVTGMSEVTSAVGPIRQWADVLALAANVAAANPGLDKVTIVNYVLMRIE